MFKADCPRKGVQQKYDVRSVAGRKQRYVAAVGGKGSCQGSPRDGKGGNTGETGDRQEGNDEVEQAQREIIIWD